MNHLSFFKKTYDYDVLPISIRSLTINLLLKDPKVLRPHLIEGSLDMALIDGAKFIIKNIYMLQIFTMLTI